MLEEAAVEANMLRSASRHFDPPGSSGLVLVLEQVLLLPASRGLVMKGSKFFVIGEKMGVANGARSLV